MVVVEEEEGGRLVFRVSGREGFDETPERRSYRIPTLVTSRSSTPSSLPLLVALGSPCLSIDIANLNILFYGHLPPGIAILVSLWEW